MFRSVFLAIALGLSNLHAQRSDSLPAAAEAHAKGDLATARKLYAAEAGRLRNRADREPYARVLEDWGETELAAGLYVEAARHGLECAAAFAMLPGREERQVSCLTITGRARVYGGEYEEASQVLERAVRVAHQAGLASSEGIALNDVGSARFYVGDYSAAYASFASALALSDGNLGAPWYARLHQLSLANLAMLQQRVGQYERALEIYRKMATGSQSLPLAQQARLLSNVGALYRRMGDPYKAIDQYRAAQKLFAQQRDQDGEIGVITNTGIVQAMDLNDLAGALDSFGKSFALAAKSGNRREQAEAKLYSSEALRRLGRYPEAARQAQEALALSDELKAPEEQWKAQLSLAKIDETKGDSAGALVRYRQVIETIEKLRQGIAGFSLRAAFLGDKAEAYDGAIRMLLRQPAPQVAELFRYMEEGKARTLRDRLAEPAAKASMMTIPEIQRRLAPRTALVEYWKSGDETATLFITAQTAEVVRTGPVRDASIDQLLEAIRADSPGWKATADELGAALVTPLPLGRAVLERLLIVPDRRLQAVPFDVLTRAGRLLIDDYEVSSIPAASMLSGAPVTRGWIWPWRRMLVAFADPVSRAIDRGASGRGTTGRGDGLFGTGLAALPGSRAEIQNVADQFSAQAQLHAGEDNRKVYITSQNLAGVPILHFATHAIADPDDPDRSRLALSGDHAGQPIEYLFAREIYDLKLTGVRLATLAACDTESGKVVAGEGVAGLSRAFLSAGVASTVSTLWRIGDQASSELMGHFYRELAAGVPVGQALRSAKMASRNRGPKHWAAFVLNGDAGVTTPRTVLSWTVVLAMLMVAAGLGYWFWRFNAKPTPG